MLNPKSAGASLAILALAVSTTVAADLRERVVSSPVSVISASDFPVAVSVLDTESMSRNGITSLADLIPGQVAPLKVQPSPLNASNLYLTIRGIGGINADQPARDPNVGVYLDGVYLARSQGLGFDIIDAERIEILRGPQGVLYGRNTLGGAVNIVSKKPSGELDFSQQFTLGGEYNEFKSITHLDLPRWAGFSTKLSYLANQHDGWVDNLGTGIDGANSLKAVGGRAHLLWEPTSKFDVGLLIIREDNEPADSSLTNPDRGEFIRYTDRPDLFQSDLTSYNLTANWDMDFATLTTSSNYSKIDGKFIVDLAGTFAQTIPFALDAVGHDENFVQEVRLASADGGSWDWIVGGFYFNKRRDIDYDYRSSQEFLDTRGVTEAELTRIVTAEIGELPGQFETSGAILGAMQSNALYGRPDDYYEVIADRFRAQTTDSLDAAARAAIDPDRFVWVVVGDATVVEPQLEQLGLAVERIEMAGTD